MGSVPTQDPVTIVKDTVTAYMTSSDTPMVSVALYCDGQGQTLGFPSDSEVGPELVFGIGSVTKVFTATMLAYQCVGPQPQKKLTDPVVNYLPASVGANGQAIKSVLLGELATQTSSFPRDFAVEGKNTLFRDLPPTPDQIQWWTDWANDGPAGPDDECAGQCPGTCYQYSNWGFVTLGFAVADCNQTSGAGYNDLLQEYITGPLGMSRTRCQVPKEWLAQGYNKNNEPVYSVPGDLKSCGADMLTFIEASLGARSGVPQQLQEAITLTHQPQPWHGQLPAMGLAWQIPKQTPTWRTKNGATSQGGYSCFVGLVPSLTTGIAILTDKFGAGSGGPTALGVDILNQLVAAQTGTPAAHLDTVDLREEVDDVP